MYCLPRSKVLDPDDFEVNLVIAIHSCRMKMTNRWLDNDGRLHQELYQTQTHGLIGTPIVIRSINLPFIICQRLTYGSELNILDTRDLNFMSVTSEYANSAGYGGKITIKNPAPIIIYDRKKRLYQHKVTRKPNRYCDSKGKPHVYKVLYEE